MLNGKVVLVTGGTGSFGQKFVEIALKHHNPRKLIVFSRDELKQFEMSQKFSEAEYPALRYFIGDVRDKDRLYRAFSGVNIIIHAAALKQVPACEYNPIEAIKTNIYGASNIIDTAIDCGVEKVIALSTDKAVRPTNLYGATKLCSDKLFVAANNYASGHAARFSVVRYGNVIGSRGSVIPFFRQKRSTGVLPVTDKRMTRFWITIEQGVNFVLKSLERMKGGEIFIPKIPSMNIMDVAKAVAPECKVETIGIRPGEKLHEAMLTEEDASHAIEYKDYFAIISEVNKWDLLTVDDYLKEGGERCPSDFQYSSNLNTEWVSVEELRKMIGFEG